MSRISLVVVLTCACLLSQAADPLWQETFDRATQGLPPNMLVQMPGHGGTLHISVAPGSTAPGRTVALEVPQPKLHGNRVFFGADVKTANVSHKPNPWNGVKVMLVIETPSGKDYPQPDIPVGTTDWQRFTASVALPADATNIVMVLGLENVTGEAWFDNAHITPRPVLQSTLKVDPSRPVFLGHNAARLRGAMAGADLSEDDVKFFATVWKGNLLRLQIFEAARKDRPLADYDAWLDQRLQHIDRMLTWCEHYGVMAALDLHSPPGGQAFSAGYITARGHIFTDPNAQAMFVEVWKKMAARYKGRPVIWGFDLVNEPDDSTLGEDCLDWNALADKTARAIRGIDPDRVLIIEPDQWGSPQGFATFQPLDLPRIVYSFHFYQPMHFTHQGLYQNPAGVTYPGLIDGHSWDKNAIERAMRPAIEFAEKYRVQMYVGEFSAIRTAPAPSAAKYLADVIDVLEKHGFDWSYHAYREWQGWSLEHEGPLDKPRKAQNPTDRQKVVTGWFSKNGQALDYAIGADLSFLKQAEDRGTVFKDHGHPKSGLQIFKDHGYNWVRLRLFHSPARLPNDLPYTLAIAKEAKQLGFKFLLDFHYSDTWADPGKQFLPKAWEGKAHAQLVKAVFEYTRDTLIAFRQAGVMPDMVQIGNEIINGMLWPDGRLPSNWDRFAELVKAGIRGVEAASAPDPRPLIMIHIDKGGNREATK